MNTQKIRSLHSGVVKDINEQLVLKLVQENETISSSDLVRITGMRPSTIFNILKGLSAKAFVKFHGKGESTIKGGKKPYVWTLNKEVAYAIGLDVEVGEMTIVLLDFSGAIAAKKTLQLPPVRTPQELAATIVKVVNEFIIECRIAKDKILGLGIAVAGIVDCQNGIVVMSSVLPEMNVPLMRYLTDLPFHVIVENNANAAAVGLKWNSKDKPKQNYITVLIEIDRNVSGLGIGIVIDGKLYRGASFSAGELYPHLPSLQEILASVRSRFSEGTVLRRYISSFDSIDIHLLLDAAKQGDKIARHAISMIGNVVGQTITPAIALLNPDTLILTGDVTEVEDVLLASVRNVIELRVLAITSNSLQIVTDKHYHYAVAVGAASLILEDFFHLLP
ncbi:MAG: ROK family protein [Bacteroidota bacterium]|nr:ROK family protein [Bacteroidota bacterium]